MAEVAGVSRSAVSRAYTEGAYVSAEARERIYAAAKKLGYRPNLVARSLSTSRSGVIGIAITRLVNAFHSELLQELTLGLRKLGYSVMLFLTDPTTDSDPPIDDVLRHRVDALILCAVRFSSTFAEECRTSGVPVVLLNRVADGVQAASVVGQNVEGGRAVAEFLLAGGHQNFAFIRGFEDSSTSRDREFGFTSALHAAGMPAPMVAAGQFDAETAADSTRALLSCATPPDAIFCANDHMALACLDVARREFGLEPGRSISIVGFDNSRPTQLAGIDLTTFSQDATTMVQRVLDILPELLADPSAPFGTAVVPGQLIVRQTARRPKPGTT
ncbi:MAG: LacI family DNA-binding transcriptional regulator [Paracoccaceae bacterium]|nr:LacI family DNA-binding transcriptional regulator [Paracoccaceae bacterium]